MRKIFFIALGIIFLGISVVGVIVPMLPAFPFLLLTSFFFMKGSDRLSEWFTQTDLYRKHLLTFKEKKGLTLKAKLSILIPVYITLISLIFIYENLILRITIVLLLLIKTIVFIKLKTIAPEELEKTYEVTQKRS